MVLRQSGSPGHSTPNSQVMHLNAARDRGAEMNQRERKMKEKSEKMKEKWRMRLEEGKEGWRARNGER